MINPQELPSIASIELWRKANGYTRKGAADLAGVTQSAYEKWCSKKAVNNITPDKQSIFAQLMRPAPVEGKHVSYPIRFTHEEFEIVESAVKLTDITVEEFCKRATIARAEQDMRKKPTTTPLSRKLGNNKIVGGKNKKSAS